MSGWYKDAGENIYEWWKKEKISGTIMPIFLLLNILKFERSGTDYTTAELIANGFMLIVMIYAIGKFYSRSQYEDSAIRESDIRKEQIQADKDVELAKIANDTKVIIQEKQVQDFAMAITKKEKEYQFNLIAEQADFITEQIQDKVEHIIFLSEHFDKADDFAKTLTSMHRAEIDNLRAYQKLLPHKLEMKFDDYVKGVDEIPVLVSTTPKMVKEELNKVLDKVAHNSELQSNIDSIKGDQS